LPIVPELIVRVELAAPPDVRTTLVGVRDALSPLEAESVREIVPAKPLMEVNVIVDVLVWPGLALMVAGLALTPKSGTVNVTVTECDRLPLLPVTMTE